MSNSIFDTITEIGDEKIYFDDFNKKNLIDECFIVPVTKIIQNCDCSHVSVIYILQLIFMNDKTLNNNDINNLVNVCNRFFISNCDVDNSVMI